MSDLISRRSAIDAMISEFKRVSTTAIRAKDVLEKLPSAEPEIILCADCRHNGSFDTDCPIKWGKTDSDFCSFAERRTRE